MLSDQFFVIQRKMSMKKILFSLSLLAMGHAYAEDTITVYAAASLTNVLAELDQKYEKKNNIKIKTSYAGSSTLAKQIEAGAPANLFISADEQWMNYLQDKKLIDPKNRKNLLGNRLVLISPKNQNIKFKMTPSFDPTTAFKGKLCTGDTKSVPVGKYAKQALTSLQWWEKIQPRLVQAEDVRVALNFVARGECNVGIVYLTDAAISPDVKVIAEFPLNTHTPIVYPMGMVKPTPETVKFYQYLQSNEAKTIFKKYGFSVLN